MPDPLRPKRILVVSYSQSGQLDRILDALCAPLEGVPGLAVERLRLRPRPAYPFPWTFWSFLDAFPESVLLRPPALEEDPEAAQGEFDLVILGWTVWFLAPVPPMTAFLGSATGRRLLAGKPVVSVIACRNMWSCAFATFKELLASAGGRLLDNVVLQDPSPVLASFISTPRWEFTGRQDVFLGLPPAGVSSADIRGAARWGHALREALDQDLEHGAEPLLRGLRAVVADPRLVFGERGGRRAFGVWSRLVAMCGPPGSPWRRPALALWFTYLVLMILLVGPLSLALQALLRPLLHARHARLRAHLEAPSGSSAYRSSVHEPENRLPDPDRIVPSL